MPFLDAWKSDLWDIIVVEDQPTKSAALSGVRHYAWPDIDEALGDQSWIISRRDSAIRCFGLWLAHQSGYDYTFSLDDDCMPVTTPEDYIDGHLRNLNSTPIWTESALGQRTRGIPYGETAAINVALSHGLWMGNPDFDSVQSMLGASFDLPQHTRVMPPSQYFPLCGMNFAFRREVTPLCYFPLMGINQPYRRFDDIWFGIIAQRAMRHLGYAITSGHPFVQHTRASDRFVNLVKEAPGIVANEEFWKIIENIPLSGTTCRDVMNEIGDRLTVITTTSEELGTYIKRLGSAITIWTGLFK